MNHGSPITVHGGGTAGSAAAFLLARAGRRVLHVVDAERGRPSPPEILSPWARSLLAQLGLPEPQEATPCEGVLSFWDGSEPEFNDYVLMTASHGLAVTRHAMRDALGRAGGAAGVRRLARTMGGDDEVSDGPGAGTYQLLARGRSVRTPRCCEDRLVALFMPCAEDRAALRLVVEPARDGWWYLPPQVGPVRYVVFVTSPALAPTGPERRYDWLRSNLACTELIQAAAGGGRFDAVAGMDARVARAEALTWPTGARIGDAALSLDPLSGTGIVRALEGAALVVDDILTRGAVSTRYHEWVESVDTEESKVRAGFYERAAARFPDGPFWQRRCAARAPLRRRGTSREASSVAFRPLGSAPV